MLLHIPCERAAEWGLDSAIADALLARLVDLVATGFHVLDMILAARAQGDHLEVYRRLFDQVLVGITHLLLHPSVPGYDIETISGSAAYRVADYQTFLRPELKDYVVGQGVHLIGYRRLRALIRAEL